MENGGGACWGGIGEEGEGAMVDGKPLTLLIQDATAGGGGGVLGIASAKTTYRSRAGEIGRRSVT